MYQKRKWSVKTVVFMGFFVAMNIVLTRFCSVNLGPFRLGFGPASTIMSGLWLGPLAGGVVGMVADLIGCLIDGYAVNPFITVSAILSGVSYRERWNCAWPEETPGERQWGSRCPS